MAKARSRDASALLETVWSRVQDHDRPGAVTAALGAVERGEIGIDELYSQVLGPLMIRVGDGWQGGQVRIWEEHLATSAVRTIVEALYPRVLEAKAKRGENGRRVLLACPPHEYHELGLRMLSDRFEMAGWTVFLLGADVPGAELLDASRRLDVELVVMTTKTLFHQVKVRDHVDRLAKVAPGLRVLVDGTFYTCDAGGLCEEEIFDEAEFFGEAEV
jgi:methanogenic corrinoid protein MtbC1